MKKLKDIGSHLWANEGLYGNQQLFLDSQCLADHPDQEEVVCLTLEERRELVSTVWNRAWAAICPRCGDVPCVHNEHSIDLEDYLKEQKL